MTEQDIRNRLRWEQMKARLADGPIIMGLDMAAPGSDENAVFFMGRDGKMRRHDGHFVRPASGEMILEGEFRVVKP